MTTTQKKQNNSVSNTNLRTKVDLGIGSAKSLIEVAQNYNFQIIKMKDKNELLNGLNNLFFLIAQSQKELETLSTDIIELMEKERESTMEKLSA